MAIPDDKARLIVTLPDRLKSNFELICKIDKRSASNQFEYILEYYINNVENRLTDKDYDDYFKNVYLRNQLIDEIVRFLSRKDGRYLGKHISEQYFYDVFKDEIIDDEIQKLVIDRLKKLDVPTIDFFKNCVGYHTIMTGKI